MQNVVTANFSHIYLWLLSNIGDFKMWNQQWRKKATGA